MCNDYDQKRLNDDIKRRFQYQKVKTDCTSITPLLNFISKGLIQGLATEPLRIKLRAKNDRQRFQCTVNSALSHI